MGGRFGFAGMLAGAALGVALSGPHHYGQTRYPAGHKPRRGYYFKPHNGEREIARRLRQAERDRENRRARAERQLARYGAPRGKVVPMDSATAQVEFGLSRRGRWVPLA